MKTLQLHRYNIIFDRNVVDLSGLTKVGNANFFSLNVVTIPNMVIKNNIKSDSTFFHRFKEVVLVIPKD